MNSRTAKKNKKKFKKRYIFLSVFLVLLLAGGGYALSVFNSLNKTIKTIHEPIERDTDKREEPVMVEDKEPFSVLLLGVDERKGDRGRSDTMIVVTVNPNDESVKMLSIPRDSYVDIIGKDMKDKINHAYAFGEVDMALDTVEEFLDIPIDYYVKINMEGFKDIVDALGGVTVVNDMNLAHGGFDFPKGEIELDGEEALVFTRIRYEDPRGDFGRQLRQKQIIQAIINEGASVSSLWNFQSIFDALGKNVKTNLTFTEMVDIQKGYANARHNIEQLQFEGSNGGFIGNIWYYFPDDQEVAKFQEIFKEHLEINNTVAAG